MNDDAAWALLESARCEDPEEMWAELLTKLSELEPPDILAFSCFVWERMNDASRYDLWEIAYLMNAGCSDDGFDYFLCWLIAQGRTRYEAALVDPEKAAEGMGPDDGPFEFGELLSVPRKAYEAKTGKTDFYEIVGWSERRFSGEPFDENTVDERHPELAKRFG